MFCRFWLCAFTLLTLSLTGCSNIEIYSKDGDNSVTSSKLKGIPFYIKVPALTQDTKLLKSELSVQIEVTVETGGSKQVTHYPNLEPIKLDDTQENRESVTATIDELVKKGASGGWTSSDTAREVTKVTEAIRVKKPTKPLEPEVVSNTWGLSMVVSPKQYYITNRVPFMGSASSDFKFASDGTLTEASSSITDDTAKTLLGLFPISALLSKQWGVKGALGPPTHVQIDGKIAQIKTLYSLRQVTLIGTTYNENMDKYLPPNHSLPPLSLEKGLKGEDGIQLLSKEIQKDTPKSKENSKVYQIEGTITPPETSSPSSSDSSGDQGKTK